MREYGGAREMKLFEERKKNGHLKKADSPVVLEPDRNQTPEEAFAAFAADMYVLYFG